MRRLLALGIVLTAAGCGCSASSPGRPLPLRAVADVKLPGSSSRFDYMTFDARSNLLVIAHLGDSTVIGFDVAARRARWTASGVSSAHGVRAAPEIGRVFASATGSNEAVAIDEANGNVVARGRTGEFPDGLAYEPESGTVYVSNKDGGSESALDAATLAPVADVKVGSDVGNVAYDAARKRMVVAVGASNELVVIDPASRRVERRLGLGGCDGAHGVALDETGAVAFVACEGNARVLRVELASGSVVASQPTGGTPDVLSLDAGLGRLYVAAEDGVVGIYDIGRGSLRTIGRARLAGGAHTVAVDPATHLVYFPLPNVGGGPALRIMEPAG
jgi:DNA-binding beta-propeller fold protein YncE